MDFFLVILMTIAFVLGYSLITKLNHFIDNAAEQLFISFIPAMNQVTIYDK